MQVNSKKDFDDCTGFEESDDGERGPVTVSFDKVIYLENVEKIFRILYSLYVCHKHDHLHCAVLCAEGAKRSVKTHPEVFQTNIPPWPKRTKARPKAG